MNSEDRSLFKPHVVDYFSNRFEITMDKLALLEEFIQIFKACESELFSDILFVGKLDVSLILKELRCVHA